VYQVSESCYTRAITEVEMRTIAIASQKGGTAKTTTTVNLAAALAEQGKRVLTLDLDPQRNASEWMRAADSRPGLLEALQGDVEITTLVQDTPVPGVEIIPSSSWLVGAERVLAGEMGSDTLLRQALASLPSRRWDFLFVDCPPSLGLLVINALAAVREVIIPVAAHAMGLTGLAKMVDSIDKARKRLNADIGVGGILPCRVDLRTRHAQESVEHMRQRFGELVFDTVIHENVRVAEAPSFGQSILEYAPASAGAADYRALAEEVLARKATKKVHYAEA
jgi:chromosome partitioning protein